MKRHALAREGRAREMRIIGTVAGLAGLCLAGIDTVATAQTVDLPTPIEAPVPQEAVTSGAGLNLTLGLGAAFAPDYEGSDDYAFVPLWNLRVGNLYHPETFVQILGPQLRSNLVPSDHWRFGVSGRYLPDYEDVDDDEVQDLEDVDAVGLLGATLGYDFVAGPRSDVALELDAQYDVAESNGGILTPRFRWRQPWSERTVFETTLATTWASEDYMSNRFGIDAGAAADSGLDTHDADEGFKSASISGSLTFRLSRGLSLTGVAAYTRLLGDAEDSPIVDDRGSENQALGGVLLNYTF
jgi:outer membrane scaffolding protein for murein synthesis (MipA/OmpV family)